MKSRTLFGVKTLAIWGIVALCVVGVGLPAEAYGISSNTLTCTSSAGYSVHIKGDAKGTVYHSLDSGAQYYAYVGGFKVTTTAHSNTHIGGTHDAKIIGFNGTVTGSVSSNVSYCGV